MKRTLLIIVILLFNNLKCQLLNIERLKAVYPVKEYTLHTKDIYEFDKKIDLFNVFLNDNTILLISILPDVETGENWKQIDKKNIKKNEISIQDFIKLVSQDENQKKLVFNMIHKNEKNKEFFAFVALAELFHIENYEFPLISDNRTINIKEQKASIKSFLKAYNSNFNASTFKSVFPLDVRKKDRMLGNVNHLHYKPYLSKEFFIKNKKAFQFWTLNDWGVIDGYNYQRGVDRFLYIPNFGIVGGSYDFYFELKPRTIFKTNFALPVSDELLWNNMINERLMIASELK
ncbi:hypothetical protein EIB71_07795 [Kaistella daneshvariae]|uniref:DUF4837 family protein n=1 Tax=Kaistella daneshvariae TaxID=2487074 RepID=A0ABM7C985_9FLAO|nr:hypothetical protein [Kaistella daneshvariae]AZI67570.1 hypothetical protein EIB71_07795 [Kaistella daneshvariae]